MPIKDKNIHIDKLIEDKHLILMNSSNDDIISSDNKDVYISQYINDNGEDCYSLCECVGHNVFGFFNSKEELLQGIIYDIKSDVNMKFKKNPLVKNIINKVIDADLKLFKNNDLDINYIVYNVNSIKSNVNHLHYKFEDNEIKKHLKNYGFKLSNVFDAIDNKNEREKRFNLVSFKDTINLETINDSIDEIVLIQKTKRLIQKTFSNRYKHLLNDNTFNLMKEVVLGENYRKFKDQFTSKLARYKNPDELNVGLEDYIKKSTGWSIENYREMAKEESVDVVFDDGGLLGLRIDTYKQSKILGSGQWCISYEEDYFHDYKSVDDEIFFVYDFNKKVADNSSMIGVVKSSIGHIKHSYLKDDESISAQELQEEFKSVNGIIRNHCDYSVDNLVYYINSCEKNSKLKQKVLKEHFSNIKDYQRFEKLIDNGFINSVSDELFFKIMENHNESGDNVILKKAWKKIIIKTFNKNLNEDVSSKKIRDAVLESESLVLFKELIDSIKRNNTDDFGINHFARASLMQSILDSENSKKYMSILIDKDFKMSENLSSLLIKHNSDKEDMLNKITYMNKFCATSDLKIRFKNKI